MKRFSASRIKVWEECPLRAHYRYDQGLPGRQNAKASFGTIVHAALQHYNDHGNDYDGARRLFLDLWAHPEKAGVEPDYWPKFTSYGGLRSKGLEVLENVHASYRFTNRTVIGTEVPFVVPFGDYELTGFIDLVEVAKSGTGTELLKVVDYKSNSRDPSASALALDIQFTCYAYAVGQEVFWVGNGTPECPGVENGAWLWETVGKMATARCVWYSLWNKREIDAGPRLQADFERLYKVLDAIDASDAAGIHLPRIGEACTWCDYTEECRMEIPVALQGLVEPAQNRWV